MLSVKKDLSVPEEESNKIWYVPETVPSWQVPGARTWHTPVESPKTWHTPVPSSQVNSKELENMSPDAGLPVRAARPAGESSSSSLVTPRKRPMPTIPGWKNTEVPKKRPIPTIPPGGTLLETTPIHPPFGKGPAAKTQSLPSNKAKPENVNPKLTPTAIPSLPEAACDDVHPRGKPMATASTSATPKKCGKNTRNAKKVYASPPKAQKEQTSKLNASTPANSTAQKKDKFILTVPAGKPMATASTSATPKKCGKNTRNAKKVYASPPKAQKEQTSKLNASTPANSTAPKKDKFILTVPAEFNFKGDAPRWIRELYLEPLLGGWKREVVERTSTFKKTADVYYYNPEGRKFRSRVEIGQYFLDHGITKYSAAFNFSFKGVVFGEEFEPFEIIRPSGKRRPEPSVVQKTTSQKKSKSNSKTMPASELIPDDFSEEGMVFDEEIEVVGTGDGQNAVFAPGVFSSPESIPLPKKQDQSILPKMEENAKQSSGNKLFCICDDIEHGDMVLCDNPSCEIGWYHFGCVNITSSPPEAWYCPICRGESSAVMNSNIALTK